VKEAEKVKETEKVKEGENSHTTPGFNPGTTVNSMKKILALTLSLTILSLGASAQSTTSSVTDTLKIAQSSATPGTQNSPPSDTSATPIAHSQSDANARSIQSTVASDTLANALLWQIKGDGINTSYIFGTIHIIPAENYFLPNGTIQAFEQADQIVFEIDMNEMTDMGAQISLLTKAFMADGKRLRDLISDEDYALVKAHFDEMGMPLSMLERIKPMFLSVFASGDISMDDMTSGLTKSYEMEFFELAKAGEKEVSGLETMEFQISIFDSIPYEAQAEMLVESIRGQDAGSSQFQEMIDVYLSQDIETLHSMLSEEGEDVDDYEEILVSGRNKDWIGKMGPLMKEGSVFFAVGAGHLGGANGVLRLLQQEGYEVVPVLGALDLSTRPKKKF
jgi:uncharacterized protein YbaP (TraB family)